MSLTATQRRAVEAAYAALGPPRLRFCPYTPTPRQEAFLLLNQLEALFGGAAGGGKSIALLMGALQFCDVPGYAALLLRPSLPEFSLPGGLMELSHEWLAGSKASWSGDLRRWRFPGPGGAGAGGATLTFGYLDSVNDVPRYAGSSFSFLGFDELVRFSESEYTRMFRAFRQVGSGAAFAASSDGTTLARVPVRVRATSNPGGPGHDWVKARFVDPPSRHPQAIFLPSRISDNPHLDQDSYREALAQLPRAERERLLTGDWDVSDDGELFQRTWFQRIERRQLPPQLPAVRYWDLAATEPGPANPDPDYTVGLRLEHDQDEGSFYVTDLIRVRKAPGAVERLVAATAQADGVAVNIYLEEEPGAAGKTVTDRYKRHVLSGYSVRSVRPTGPKQIRAQPVAAAAENRFLKLLPIPQVDDFLDELVSFPNGAHDDCVDALAGAHTALVNNILRPARWSLPPGRIPNRWDTFINARRALAHRPGPTVPTRADEELAARIGVHIYRGGW